MSGGESARQDISGHGNLEGAKDSTNPTASNSDTNEPKASVRPSPKTIAYQAFTRRSRKFDDTSKTWIYLDHVWDSNSETWRTTKSGGCERWWIENPPSLSKEDPGYLCELCRHIDFGQLIDKPDRGEEIYIGTPLYHSQQTSCSFCSLITHGYQLHRSTYQTFDGVVQLYSIMGIGVYDFCRPHGHLGLSACDPGDRLFHRSAIYRIGTRPGDGRRVSAKVIGTNSGRDWLPACETSHDTELLETVVHDLLLVDLVDGCVKSVSGSCKYAALSYARGELDHVRKSTKEMLEESNDLFSDASQTPQTFKDAAELTRHIGLQYLWVDSLCIPQDDAADKETLHRKIRTIYKDAAITIVDAYGSSPNDGLPGISIPRSDTYIRQLQGIELGISRDVSSWERLDAIQISPWSDCGWTFQEKIMSSRLLYVTEKQLEFKCEHTMYFEEVNAHRPQKKAQVVPKRIDPTGRLLHQLSQWHYYGGSVERFSRRTLTHDTDVLSAFSVVLEILGNGKPSTHFFNLPTAVLDEALLWTTKSPYDFDRTYRELPGTVAAEERKKCMEYWKREHRRNTPEFPTPSWSWAGWDHAVQYPVSNLIVPSILWKCRTTNGPEHLLSSQELRCANWRELGWKCLKLEEDTGPLQFVYVHPSKPDLYFQHPVALSPDGGNVMSPMQGSTLLTFQGFCLPIATKKQLEEGAEARMSLGPERHNSWRWLEANIFDETGHKAGGVRLDVSPANHPPGERNLGLVALSRFSTYSYKHPYGSPFPADDPLDLDETALKNISLPRQDCKPTGKRYLYFQKYDEEKFEKKLLDCYSVLLVQWVDGIAYRMGLGHIHIDAFHAADPVWQDVCLG